MYCYYNANPLGRKVNDCTVRALSLAYGVSWDTAFDILSDLAQVQATMPDDIYHIDGYLIHNAQRVYNKELSGSISVGQFVDQHPIGIYLITMRGHITCAIDGCIYDTFDPSDRIVEEAFKVSKRGLL